MAEAAEIAKLRLFLKLAAQLDEASHIEPLPDLDFNIKSGNLLVGIADRDDITRRFSDRGVLPFGLEEIEDAVESIAMAYEQFVAIQDSTDDLHVLQQAKGRLKSRINAVTDQADRGLHKMRGDAVVLETWKETHNPFHWFIEFPTVWRNGGFDVIIGNPPYIGLKGNKRNQFNYTWIGYKTRDCPDLYAVCTEWASMLLNVNGRFAMIVMHSLCFGEKYGSLRSHLLERLPTVWASSYALIPDCLFSGSAKVRNTIVLGTPCDGGGLFTTRCRRWLTDGRSTLFSQIEYAQPYGKDLGVGESRKWPFSDSPLVIQAFRSMSKSKQPIGETLTLQSEFGLAIAGNARYLMGIYADPPLDILPDGSHEISKKYEWLWFPSKAERGVAWLVLAGRWGYLWWLMWDDEYHVKCSVLNRLPASIEDLTRLRISDTLMALAERLEHELPRHLAYKKNSGRHVARLDISKCRHITDEADWLLAQAWGLTREQYETAGNLRDRMTFGKME